MIGFFIPYNKKIKDTAESTYYLATGNLYLFVHYKCITKKL